MSAWVEVVVQYIAVVGGILLVYWVLVRGGSNLPPIINSIANLNSSAIYALKA